MNETTNTQATPVAPQETAQTQRPADVTITTKVLAVRKGAKFGKVRLIFAIDKQLDGFDENGNPTTRTDFSLDCYNALQQLAALDSNIALANAMAMGEMIKPQIFALALNNAEITITRTYKFAGEARETGNAGDTYQRDCWKTTITKVKANVLPNFVGALNALLADPIEPKATPTLNGFNVG